jgi:hypothetical protein
MAQRRWMVDLRSTKKSVEAKVLFRVHKMLPFLVSLRKIGHAKGSECLCVTMEVISANNSSEL